MSQMKMVVLTSCSLCLHSMELDGKRYCNNVSKFMEREDIFVLENGSAVDSKFPDWCPLKDYPKNL